jgi:hypothetical protein
VKHKTLAQHYDFNYDGGKGHKYGPEAITPRTASTNPVLKNKMSSYTFGRAGRP